MIFKPKLICLNYLILIIFIYTNLSMQFTFFKKQNLQKHDIRRVVYMIKVILKLTN